MGALSDLMGMGAFKKRGSGKSKSNAPAAGTASSGGAGENMDSYHSGGKVRKTGPARLKKGETVLTKTQMKRMKRRGSKKR